MTNQHTHSLPGTPPAAPAPTGPHDLDFEESHGEPLAQVLNLDTWMQGGDLLSVYGRTQQEVEESLAQMTDNSKVVREHIFPRIPTSPHAPRNAGLHRATVSEIERIHKGLLFNGGVEACDGTSVVHDTIPLTITQIGVSLVSYNGDFGTWAHRLFRRDLRSRGADPVEETMAILERRAGREAQGMGSDGMSELARRGIMAYAERAILKDKSTALWRMGHGSPAPYELLTGLWASKGDRLRVALDLIEWYVNYKRFVFVPSAPRKRHLLMMGNALEPLEFVIWQNLQPDIDHLIEAGGYRDESGARPLMREFAAEVAPHIVVGLYRAWKGSPPFMFYAHEDYAEMAARIVIADSILQEYRGFPMLIDLADNVCSATFGADTFRTSVDLAYSDAGEPFRYLGERTTRP